MIKKEALDIHKKLKGKIEVTSKIKNLTKKQLRLVYTPGVAEVSREIARTKNTKEYTIKGNTVAVVSDGSSILGLGNLGPEAALPVMEGKAMLFKQLANIDAFPLCLDTQETEELVQTVKHIAPVFGGINLEDIAAPRCFEVEDQLQNIGIPVMHDDQHGTAIVVLASLLNAARVTKKRFEELHVVVNGAGAAGQAIAKLLVCASNNKNLCTSVREVIVCDSKGILYKGRPGLNPYKERLVKITNRTRRKGSLSDALVNADVFVGVSKGNIVSEAMVKSMNKDPIVFGLSNPTPEIMPDKAKRAGAKVIATGRSDFPNQVNNALVFPGVFRGALDSNAKRITNEMKLAAAHALAATVKNPRTKNILPSLFDKRVVQNIARAVKKAA